MIGTRKLGFTLIELLVALSIFAIMSVLSYRTLASVFDSREHLTEQNARLRDTALFFARIENDLTNLLDRPSINTAGLTNPPLQILPNAVGTFDYQIGFTRSGYAGAEGLADSPQRIGYRLRDNRIEWLGWSHPDIAPRSEPKIFPALSDVQSFKVLARDINGTAIEQWPTSTLNTVWPAAIEINVTLMNGENVVRLFALRQHEVQK